MHWCVSIHVLLSAFGTELLGSNSANRVIHAFFYLGKSVTLCATHKRTSGLPPLPFAGPLNAFGWCARCIQFPRIPTPVSGSVACLDLYVYRSFPCPLCPRRILSHSLEFSKTGRKANIYHCSEYLSLSYSKFLFLLKKFTSHSGGEYTRLKTVRLSSGFWALRPLTMPVSRQEFELGTTSERITTQTNVALQNQLQN